MDREAWRADIHWVAKVGHDWATEWTELTTVKGFFSDPADIDNLISGSSAFSKTSLNVWKFMVHLLLKPGLENFKHYLIANIRCIMEKAREFQKNIYFCFIDCAKAFDCVDHNKLWKILKGMGIPDHLTCRLRNLYAGQEELDMEQQTGSK